MPSTTTRRLYVGLFLCGFVTLFFETLLTRLFSVTMWYHYAFLAVSVAMFGLSLGGAAVYAAPAYFTADRVRRAMGLSMLAFAVTGFLSLLSHLSHPCIVNAGSMLGLFAIGQLFIVLSIPFFFLGIVFCLALTRFAESVGKLYAADLAGAASGSLAFLFVLEYIDPFAAALLIFGFGCLAATCFLPAGEDGQIRRIALILWGGFMAGAAVQIGIGDPGRAPLRVIYSKESIDEVGLVERWNAYSRVKVGGDPNNKVFPFLWGYSSKMPESEGIEQLHLKIDSAAGTVLTAFDGDVEPLFYLRYDISNLVHRLRDDASVAVMGVGGGRDVLSALVYGQRSVDGIDYNHDVLGMLTDDFADFTGHLDDYTTISLHLDDARRFLTTTEKEFDIIQASLVDTWAATTAGAYTFAENSLYTVEGWRTFLERLTPTGLVSFSRWFDPNNPEEAYRLASVVGAALRGIGVENPADHVAIAYSPAPPESPGYHGVATLLASREPLDEETLTRFHESIDELDYVNVYSPDDPEDRKILALLGTAEEAAAFADSHSLNLTPPTDDSPFFFNMLRPEHILSWGKSNRGIVKFNMRAVFVLGALILFAAIVHFFCLVPPLSVRREGASPIVTAGFLLYFTGIGLGFMLTEIALLQRLSIFLGHPTLSFLLVLPALLIGSALGSFISHGDGGIPPLRLIGIGGTLLVGSVAVLAAGLDPLVQAFGASGDAVRFLIAAIVCLLPGVFMGMCFPLGMRLADRQAQWLTPWLWAVNGTASVLASALALAIAMFWGTSTVFICGCIAYAVSFAVVAALARRTHLLA